MKNPSLKEDKRTCGVDSTLKLDKNFNHCSGKFISKPRFLLFGCTQLWVKNSSYKIMLPSTTDRRFSMGVAGGGKISCLLSEVERYINYTRTGIIESCNYWSFSLPERLKIYLWCKTWSGVKFSNHVFYLHAILYLAKNITSKKSLESYPGMLHRQSRTDVLWVVLDNGRSKQKKTTLLVEQ